jgi:hypothetical protein
MLCGQLIPDDSFCGTIVSIGRSRRVPALTAPHETGKLPAVRHVALVTTAMSASPGEQDPDRRWAGVRGSVRRRGMAGIRNLAYLAKLHISDI